MGKLSHQKGSNNKNSCSFRNYCAHPNLCCSFCEEAGCGSRCMDDHLTCKYLIAHDDSAPSFSLLQEGERTNKHGYIIPNMMESMRSIKCPPDDVAEVYHFKVPFAKRARPAKNIKRKGG